MVFGSLFEILILKTKTVTSVRHYYQNIRRGKEKRKTKTHRCRHSVFENEVRVNIVNKRFREENKGACLTKHCYSRAKSQITTSSCAAKALLFFLLSPLLCRLLITQQYIAHQEGSQYCYFLRNPPSDKRFYHKGFLL